VPILKFFYTTASIAAFELEYSLMFLMICAIKFKVKLKRKILFKTFIARASHFLFLINVSYFLNSFKTDF